MTSPDRAVPSPLGSCADCMRQDERSPATTLLEGTSLCDKCALRRMHKTDADVHLDQLRKADKRRGGEIWW